MIRRLIMLVSILAGATTMLAACYALLFVTVRVEKIQTPALHAGAVVATLVIGVLLLVSATYFSTHLVVRLFRKEATGDRRPATSDQRPVISAQ